MSAVLRPSDDHPFAGALPEPKFAEAQQWNVTDGTHGVIYHVGTYPGDLGLWHNVFGVTCPDGSVLATKVVGRGETGMFGTHSVHTVTVEPYKSWRLRFEGGLRKYAQEDLWKGPGADGEHVAASVDIELTAMHPVWEPGARKEEQADSLFKTQYRLHHEQAVRAQGVIRYGDQTVAFSGVGHRDHSQGPRERTTIRGLWVNGCFDSGWAFCAMEGLRDPGGQFERSAIFEGGEVHAATLVSFPPLEVTAPFPRDFELPIRDHRGRVRTLRVSRNNGATWFGTGPTEWCVGADLSKPHNYVYTHCFATFECDGEMGIGFVDQGARAAHLRFPD